MTLFTSLNKIETDQAYAADSRTASAEEKSVMDTAYYLKSAFIYLIIAVIIGIAGAVYEHFSFGVYSNFMIYAFAVPLLGGTLPHLISALRSLKSEEAGVNAGNPEKSCSETLPEKSSCFLSSVLSCWTYHAAIATLTAGSIMQGILAICGRPNGLVIVYPITAAALLAAAAAIPHIHLKKSGTNTGSKALINSESADLPGEDNGGGKADKYAGSNTAEH